jgi:hypothetical protein
MAKARSTFLPAQCCGRSAGLSLLGQHGLLSEKRPSTLARKGKENTDTQLQMTHALLKSYLSVVINCQRLAGARQYLSGPYCPARYTEMMPRHGDSPLGAARSFPLAISDPDIRGNSEIKDPVLMKYDTVTQLRCGYSGLIVR